MLFPISVLLAVVVHEDPAVVDATSLSNVFNKNEMGHLALATRNEIDLGQSSLLEDVLFKLGQLEEKIDKLYRRKDYMSAFTVKRAEDGPTYRTIRFTWPVTNIGGHYNTTTGEFTCQYPGVYVFHLSIMKDSGEKAVSCAIRLNGKNQVSAFVDLGSINYASRFMSSNTVILHLASGDVVTLGSCSSASSMNGNALFTSFSGFLLAAD